MSERFFVEEPITGPSAKLVGQEAQHLIKVLRAKTGDKITVFDGGGDEFTATISATSRSEVELAIEQRLAVNRELPIQLTIGVALPKGDRQRWLVEKLTELGVSRLVPLRTMRGVAQPVDEALSRLRRYVIEASKQCGRNRFMAIGEPQTCENFVSGIDATELRLIAHPISSAQSLSSGLAASGVTVAVGPEGGFTDEEVRFAMNYGWQCIELGPRILRVETAAIALAAILGRGR